MWLYGYVAKFQKLRMLKCEFFEIEKVWNFQNFKVSKFKSYKIVKTQIPKFQRPCYSLFSKYLGFQILELAKAVLSFDDVVL